MISLCIDVDQRDLILLQHKKDGVRRFFLDVVTQMEAHRDFDLIYASLRTYHQDVSRLSLTPYYRSSLSLLKQEANFKKEGRKWNGDIFGELPKTFFDRIDACFFLHSMFSFPRRILNYRNNLPCFVYVHDLIPSRYPQYFSHSELQQYQIVMKSFFKLQRLHIFCNSLSTKNDLIEFFGVKEQTITVAYLGSHLIQKHRDTCLDQEKLCALGHDIEKNHYFLFVSRYIPRKDPLFCLKIYYEFLQQFPNNPPKLVLVGTYLGSPSKEYFQKILEFIEDHQLSSLVILMGYVSDDDLVILYRNCLALIFPSVYEGFGLTPFEAMECGAFVLAGSHSSLPEVLGDSGALLPLNDAQRWVDVMTTVYKTPEKREERAVSAREQARKFSWQKNYEVLKTTIFDFVNS